MVNGEKAPTPPLLRLETLLALGLDQRTTENALVNSKVTANLAAVVAEVRNSLLLSPVQHSLDFGERCSALHLPQGFGFCSPTLRVASAYEQAGITGCDKSVGNLLYAVATKYRNNALVHRPALISYIVSTKIKNPAQLDVALSFPTNTGPGYWEV
ncbi:Glutaminyl-tRNA synthetase [Hordeum vulgare]|nr:Glutaminyl-tRNA synthetase [Hordeum vulgare]